MSVSLGKIVKQINVKIAAGGQNPIDTARLVGSVEALETRYSVANVAALPPAAFNTGRFIYVENICAYRFSDGTQWTNDYDTTLSVFSNSLWSWGRSYQGVLGTGTTDPACSPTREFYSATDWCQVSAHSHTSAVKTSGQLWSWGAGGNANLGNGTVNASCSPVQEICSATNWCLVGNGYGFSLAIKTSGELWSWGNNTFCQLGDGTATTRCSPVREICSAIDWCSVGGGNSFSVALKTSGQIWSWGANYSGRLGDGTTIKRASPVREISSSTNWCQISTKFVHTAAIKTSGELWAWGYNDCTQIGDGTATNRCSPVREICSATDWCQVSAGRFHTAAVKTSGELWTWGINTCGRLGDGTTVSSCSPVREFYSATDWCQVALGCVQTSAIKTSGELWTWGCNCCGRLGDGTTVTRCSPVREFCSATDWCQASASAHHTTALKTIRGFNEP